MVTGLETDSPFVIETQKTSVVQSVIVPGKLTFIVVVLILIETKKIRMKKLNKKFTP